MYVFMPPNLGGFFMVRSYYPSECHADYFDFERIEALKPAIEACGISTLSQSPMLGFHKQMDNRIKLLEEILSFLSLGTVRHPRRFKIVVIDIQITLKQMLRDFIGIRVNRAKKSGMVNITSSVNSRERSGINTILHELNPL